MKSPYVEKVLIDTAPAIPALALAPAAVSMPNGTVALQPARDARRRAEAARPPRWGPKKNILETLAASGRFKTLEQALKDTNLTDMLSEKGPFTLFAPTDEAFAKLPSPELRSLLADKARLRWVLTHHIVAEVVLAPRAGSPKTAPTVDGRKVTISVESDGGYSVDDARLVKTNLRASNGVIHAINSVLLPR